MRTVLVGIDEAGYGPLLGPLCVGLSAFSVCHAETDATVPNLWTLLDSAVCREPGRAGARDAKHRIPVADSKSLKLSNSSKTVHPLVHLERAVLAFAGVLHDRSFETDAALFDVLHAHFPRHVAYQSQPIQIPLAVNAAESGICRNILQRACASAGVRVEEMRCRVISEPEFNEIIRSTGNKGETTASAFGAHLRHVWERFSSTTHDGEPSRLGVVCDRLGGRACYAGILERELRGVRVEIVEETETRSSYIVTADSKRAGISFLTEGESAHLSVALASMIAKYVREMMMSRFNTYFTSLARRDGGMELKPTAGYALDGRRWLDDASKLLRDADREALVRRA